MMGVAMTIMQAIDWKKYSFEEWCRQLGAWTNGDNERMIRIVRTAPTKRITQKQIEKALGIMSEIANEIGFKDMPRTYTRTQLIKIIDSLRERL